MNLENVIAVRPDKRVCRDGKKAIKIFDDNFSKADILNEALNQARVEETGLNIPKVLEVTKIDNKWAIVSEFISGKTLDSLMKENPKKSAEYIELLVDIQLEIQSKRSPLLSRLYDKMLGKIATADIDGTTRYDLHTRLESMAKHNKLCHGDFNPSNVIITDEGKAYIIDWSHATQGSGSADAARTYLWFWLQGEIELADKYLDAYCRHSGVQKKYVQSWFPIVAASQSVKGNEKEREFLLSWVAVVDYE